MNIPLLVIGTGYDGPSDTIYLPTSIEDAVRVFGAYRYEWLDLLATDEGFTLSTEPDSALKFETWRDWKLSEYEEIKVEEVSGTAVTTERIGKDIELVCSYRRERVDSDVYYAVAESINVTGVTPYVIRVAGTPATGYIGGANKVLLESQYDGSLYNDTQLSVHNDVLTIKQPANKGMELNYNLRVGGSLKTTETLADEINLDYAKGYSCIKAEVSGSGQLDPTYPISAQLSGGTNGEITINKVQALLNGLDLFGVKVVCLPGLKVDVSLPYTVIREEFLEDLYYPTIFVHPVDLATAPVSGTIDVSTVCGSKVIIDQSVYLSIGEGRFSDTHLGSYWGNMATVTGALISSFSGEHTPINLTEYWPQFTEAELEDLAYAGLVAYTGSLLHGLVPYYIPSTNPEWDVTILAAYRAAVYIVYPILNAYIGKSVSSAQMIEDDINEALSRVPLFSDYSCYISKQGRQTLIAEILVRPFGKVRSIKFGISVNL